MFLWTMIAPKDTEAIDKSCLQNQSDKMGILTLMVTHIYLLSLNLHSYKSGQCYFSTPMLMVHLYIQGIEKQPTEVQLYKKDREGYSMSWLGTIQVACKRSPEVKYNNARPINLSRSGIFYAGIRRNLNVFTPRCLGQSQKCTLDLRSTGTIMNI